MNDDASRAPKPDNLTGAQADADAEPEATETEAAERAATEAETKAATAREGDEVAASGQGGERQDAADQPGGDTSEDGPGGARTTTAAEAGSKPEGSAAAAEAMPADGEAPAGEDGQAAPATGERGAATSAVPAEGGAAGSGAVDAQPAEAGAVVEGDEVDEERDEEMVAELVAARAEAEGYLDDLRRLQAEFDNYRKRTMREQTARIASASQALVSRLLPVLDNFELAVSHAEQSRDFDRMLKGVEMVFGELREVLATEGLVLIEAEGKPFDPERHEAVVAVEQEGAETGTVVDVIRQGYEFNGRVLRPAMVKVAR